MQTDAHSRLPSFCPPVDLIVGANGVSVGVPNPLLVGQAGQVSFDIMVDGKLVTISARAKVMYCIISNNEFKVGFQFLNLELTAMTALARFMR